MSGSTDYVYEPVSLYGILPPIGPNTLNPDNRAAIDIAKEISDAYKQGFQDGRKCEREYQLAIHSVNTRMPSWEDYCG